MSTNDINLLMENLRDLKQDVKSDIKEVKEDVKEVKDNIDKLKIELETIKKSNGFIEFIKNNLKWLLPLILTAFYMVNPTSTAPDKGVQAINKATATVSSTYVHLRAYDSLTGNSLDIK